jgi:plasmid stabilization system protein ParE
MRLEFHPEAEVDLIETILYYETQALGLGERFAGEVRHAIEQLLEHPKIGAPDEEGFHKWVLDTFPYNLRYSESDDLLYILVVESQHRKPGYWKSRIAR